MVLSKTIGNLAEKLAKQYLQKQGLVWLNSNYQCRMGEIDLVMLDKDMLVFVEVRARRSMHFGGAAASITPSKQKKLIKTAQFYQLQYPRYQNQACRFDCLILQGLPPKIDWLKNAITINY